MYQRGDISRPNFWIIRKLTLKWLHREPGIIEKKCGYKMCSSNSTGRKHCKMIIEKQKIAFIDLLKKQTINKNKSLHFILFFNWSKNQLSMPFIKIRNNLYWRWTKRINLDFLRGKESFFLDGLFKSYASIFDTIRANMALK